MNRKLALALWIVTGLAHADPAADENARLRSENTELKARIEALQNRCSAGVMPETADQPRPAANNPPVSRIPPPADEPQAGRSDRPYASTGCSKGGLFTAGVDAAWKHPQNWSALHKGLSMAEVEQQLGVEHDDVSAGDRTGWQYGKCGKDFKAQAVFDGGRLLFWQAPEF